MASSSLSSSSFSDSNPPKYDVFLSFRGEDTRNKFTSFLYDALRRNNIETFIDSYEVRKGDEISSSISNAIQSSSLSIVIFSENYASSSWCLNELLQIFECSKTQGHIILPVFYYVSPSDIRKQTGTYGDAFAKHEKCFRKMKDKVRNWRAALTHVANLSGWDLNHHDGSESEFVNKIVKDILKRLNYMSSGDHLDGLVGIASHMAKLESLIRVGDATDVRVIGIWGMGGIGKTTIARSMFNQIANQFEAFCFLGNVIDDAKYGSQHLLEKLLFEILEIRNININTFMLNKLRRKKILVVLDDVNDSKHIKFLGDHCLFGSGSRIIVTSRDNQVLKNCVDELYEVKGLNHHEALQLFSVNAFKQNHPPEEYMELSSKIINYAQGNPLALKVLGCFLLGRSKLEWKSSLDKLKKYPNLKIQNELKISYEGLDYQEKEIFLFIACFFKGEEKNRVTTILDSCGFYTEIGISVLVDKCLLTMTKNRLLMHDLIQEMGHGIILHESIKEPGERSRLWNPQDICNVFMRNTGSSAIESISLDLSQISGLHLCPDAFMRMSRLKLLKFFISRSYDWFKELDKVHVYEGLELLPDELRYLCWYGYPLKSLPSKFNPEHLVELELPYSNIEHLWKDTKPLGNLRRINLHYSKQLTEVPDLSHAPNLQILDLFGCSSLAKFPKISWNVKQLDLSFSDIEEVPAAIESLNKLVSLKLSCCTKLKNLPTSIRHLTSLAILLLDGCSKINEFPDVSEEVTYLCLNCTAIEEIPSFVERFTKLNSLSLRECRKLKRVSSSIFKLKSLNFLLLSGCSKLDYLPEVSEIKGSLFGLSLDRTAIKKFPSSIALQPWLSHLDMGYCKNLESLSISFCNLTNLSRLDLSGCFGVDKMLENVLLSSLSSLGLSSLEDLNLSECNLIELPGALSRLSSLKRLCLKGNNFESLSLKPFPHLKSLDISHCERLQSLQEFPLQLFLIFLNANHCISLETFPTSNVGFTDTCYTEQIFQYCNCVKLDQNARIYFHEDVRQTVQLKANNAWKIPSTKSFAEDKPWASISFCFPGSEILKWFNYQEERSSVTVDLPVDWYNNKFFGFVLCIVASCESSIHGNIFVHCKCNFMDNDDEWQEILYSLQFSKIELLKSDHLFLKSCYHKFKDVVGDRSFTKYSFCQKARFQFSLSDYDFSKLKDSMRVKKCGVHLLYSESEDESVENCDDIANEEGEENPNSELEVNTLKVIAKKVFQIGLALFCIFIFLWCSWGIATLTSNCFIL